MDENLKKFLMEVLSLSTEVVDICGNLGAMRSILAFSNLDRMKESIIKDDNFCKLSVIDADMVLWLSKYIRYEKKLPPGGIDELMDLRDTWSTSSDKIETESKLGTLNSKIEDLEKQINESKADDEEAKQKLTIALENHEETKCKLNSTIKDLRLLNAEKSGEIYTFKERLKETESNNAELRKVLKKFNGNGTVRLTRSPFAYNNDR